MNEDHQKPYESRISVIIVEVLLFPSFRFNTASIDCGSEVVLRPGDIVICRECGYRILFKKRTRSKVSGLPYILDRFFQNYFKCFRSGSI